MNELISATVLFITVTLLVSGPAMPAAAAGAGGGDCRDYGVDYKKSEGLTKEEITERMDKALFNSLNKYDDCLQQPQSRSKGAEGGSSGGGEGGGSGNGSGSANSTAASGIQGTDAAKKSAGDRPDAAAAGVNSGNAAGDNQASAGKLPENSAMANGKLPEDIPSADNDTILQQKVREAAMNEPDPEKKAKLWNEYRKLKGIPLKDQSNI
ncbi:MAG: hypothetical protein EP348_07035 [Alphaproteobacteria bacterium]|nr:MAG: hypothetical protein EP348_07035 [Alphaproteobacteria bacterium]